MTNAPPAAEDDSWAGELQYLAQLHTAMLAAPAGSCGAIKEKIHELERRLGITFEAAVAVGLISQSRPLM